MLSTLSFAGARVHKKPKFPSMLKMLDAGCWREGEEGEWRERGVPGCRLVDRQRRTEARNFLNSETW